MKLTRRMLSMAGFAMLPLLTGFCGTGVPRQPAPDPLRQILPQLQDGDLIFIRIANPLFLRVAATTGSWETHVGILFSGPHGSWQVAESTFPWSKVSTLDRFIARSQNRRFYISRWRAGLTALEKNRLRQAAFARLGIGYDLGFDWDSLRLYCSKFVATVYREATGAQIGRVETFRELLEANPHAPLWFWEMWFLGDIPWDRRCVTTTSELKSPDFTAVYDSVKDISHFPRRCVPLRGH